MNTRLVVGSRIQRSPTRLWAFWLLSGLVGLPLGYSLTEYGRIRWRVAHAQLPYHPVGRCATLSGPGAGGRLRYVALGDSTAQGIGACDPCNSPPYLLALALTAYYSPVIVTNLAVSGVTTRDVIQGQLPQMDSYTPNLVTVFVGTNDLTRGRRRAGYLADLDHLLSALDTGPAVVVTDVAALCCCPLLSPLDRTVCQIARSWFNRAVPAVVARHRAHLAPIAPTLTPAFTQNPALWAADGYHPSDAGYQLWEEYLLPGVLAAIAAQSDRPSRSPAARYQYAEHTPCTSPWARPATTSSGYATN